MSKTPEAALDLLMKVWPKAVARVQEEVADMQEIADRGRPRRDDRTLGLSLLCRKGPQGQVRSGLQ